MSKSTVTSPRHTTGSNIPLRTPLSRQSSTASNTSAKSRISTNDPAHRWKQKFEESEEKRKKLLSEKEKGFIQPFMHTFPVLIQEFCSVKESEGSREKTFKSARTARTFRN